MASNTPAQASDLSDGPVLSVINKRIRALRKKQNRILQMEESLSQGKTLNKEQEEVLRSKPLVIALIDELEKLRAPLSSAVSEELALHHQQQQQQQPTQQSPPATSEDEIRKDELDRANNDNNDSAVSDLLNLLYFGSLFDVKSQSDFTATMLTRTHERGCCLTYDYVTDDATDLLGERDLDMISMLSGLLVSRPIDSSLSHKNALQRCIEHAQLWLANSDQPIEPNANITYAGLRERLNKIMVSDYFITTPEMKAPVEMAAAANYASFQVPVQGSVVPVAVPVQMEGSAVQYQEQLLF
ncbi:glycine-rich protein [Melia azedarach]|uniref:Glycine-rich protein n=1 Tax=Melia azedarach TaxID=155640 RepID=A0ACC1XJ47_MELAZ|nr:glycine-rich protein [Melia azedarach]